MANKIPSWQPDAIPTSLGWAHPLTGEQLVSHDALEDAVSYYIPNAGAKSFINPESEIKTILRYTIKGKKVIFKVLSLDEIEDVTWNFGDDDILAGASFTHIFDEDGIYNVSAVANILSDGESSTVNLSAQVTIGNVVPPAPTPLEISDVYIFADDGVSPIAVGVPVSPVVNFVELPEDLQSLSYEYVWKIDGVDIVGATSAIYTPVEGDLGKLLSVHVTVSNGDETTSDTSPGVEVLEAP